MDDDGVPVALIAEIGSAADDAVVITVPLVAGSVSVVVPATAGGEMVTAPDVAPLSVKLPIRSPPKLKKRE